MIGLAPTLGYEVNADACRTAQAAGHRRVQADVRALDSARLAEVEGWVSGPPCPTYAASGKRTGHTDYGSIVTAVPRLADTARPRRFLDGVAAEVVDPRTALVLETLDVALAAPSLRWLVAEQVPAVAGIWQEFAAELAAMHRWDACTVLTLRADDFGAATRRTRVFLIATRDGAPDLTGLPYRARWDCHRFGPGPTDRPPNAVTPFPLTSMAAALGWPPGVRINTRGNRRTSGGNEFAADLPALSLTGNGARTWYRIDRGPVAGRLTDAEAGTLQTFPRGYPWQGSRSSRFQRIADAVPPVMAAAVLGAAARRPWQPAVWQRLAEVYGHTRPYTPCIRPCLDMPASLQLDLFTLPAPAERSAA